MPLCSKQRLVILCVLFLVPYLYLKGFFTPRDSDQGVRAPPGGVLSVLRSGSGSPTEWPRSPVRNTMRDMMAIESFYEEVYCPTEERIGRPADGGKWVCHPRIYLNRGDCVVYSFGSNADTTFEWGVNGLGPDCEIHIFDPTPNLNRYMFFMPLPRHTYFHSLGLTSAGQPVVEINGEKVAVKTLEEVMKMLGHTHLTLLKIDVEESEFNPGLIDLGPDSVWRKVGQLLIELHLRAHGSDFLRLCNDISAVGFRLFHKEANPFEAACWEFAYVNPSYRPELFANTYSESMKRKAADLMSTKLEEYRLFAKYSGQSHYSRSPFLWWVTEPISYECATLQNVMNNPYYHFCESSFAAKGDTKVVYVFEDTLPAADLPWNQDFVEKYPKSVIHIWIPATPERPLPASTGDVFYHDLSKVKVNPKEDDEVPSLKVLMEENGHKTLDILHVGVGNGVQTLLNFLPTISAYSTLLPRRQPPQVLLDASFCSYRKHPQPDEQYPMLMSLITGLEEADFVNLKKDPNPPKMRMPPTQQAKDENRCEWTFTFIRKW